MTNLSELNPKQAKTDNKLLTGHRAETGLEQKLKQAQANGVHHHGICDMTVETVVGCTRM